MKLAALSLLVCMGCAGAMKPETRTAESIVRSESAPASLVDAATGKEIDLETLLAAVRTKQVLYVGERHDQPLDHNVQYSILRHLHREEPSLAIGMEMFQTPYQQPLDEWRAGRIDETVLRRETEYDKRWGFDFSMYRPILEYARSNGIEVVALNAPRELAYAVAKDGVDGLSRNRRRCCRSWTSATSSTVRSSMKSSTLETTLHKQKSICITRRRSSGTRRWRRA